METKQHWKLDCLELLIPSCYVTGQRRLAGNLCCSPLTNPPAPSHHPCMLWTEIHVHAGCRLLQLATGSRVGKNRAPPDAKLVLRFREGLTSPWAWRQRGVTIDSSDWLSECLTSRQKDCHALRSPLVHNDGTHFLTETQKIPNETDTTKRKANKLFFVVVVVLLLLLLRSHAALTQVTTKFRNVLLQLTTTRHLPPKCHRIVVVCCVVLLLLLLLLFCFEAQQQSRSNKKSRR